MADLQQMERKGAYDMDGLAGTHDLRQLPAWGPYTKQYIGISHIADAERGKRFDLSLFPGFYRRKVDIPNVMWESGYHPWQAAPDLCWYTHRHELEWKDRVYADISFAGLTGNQRTVRCDFVNDTDSEHNAVLHYMASLHDPQVSGHGERLRTVRAQLPAGVVWTDALDYHELEWAQPEPADHLVYDGKYRGEVRGQELVGGSALRFARGAGDRVVYRIILAEPWAEAGMLLRWRMAAGEQTELLLDAGEVTITQGELASDAGAGAVRKVLLMLTGTGEMAETQVNLGRLAAGDHELVFVAAGGRPVELDGFIAGEKEALVQVRFVSEAGSLHPERLAGPVPGSLLLRYEGVESWYGLRWAYANYEVREFQTDELDRFMRHNLHHHTSAVFRGEGEGHFTNVYLRPIPLRPRSHHVVYGMVCCGSRDEVEKALANWDGDLARCEADFAEVQGRTAEKRVNPSGEPYRFSQRLMEATLLTNVVYPVYVKRSYIRHGTPGRWWDSLYTWDAGFIGIGLKELDIRRAVECLNAYVTEPGDPHAAFIHHGSMVPVQHYLFLELWNKTQTHELLAYFYPRLRQYYLFYTGQVGRSTTASLGSGLLRTWDYFYNSGGWDDYSPQVEVHRQGLAAVATPVSNTCHVIRIARILRMAASALGGLAADIAGYEADEARLSDAIQAYAWDEASGYFGYVLHDEAGQPAGLLRHESGQNLNMGFDGVYPLLAGICTPEQEQRLTDALMDSNRLWSSIGLTAVDQSAPYYRKDGYWNGAVWMPHQWFFWKTLLGLGRSGEAHRIAHTALELWQREVGDSYNCFEHFIVESGRGAGWHHFGGLSAPVLNWFAAYHRPGTLTCGYDVWVERSQFNEQADSLSAQLRAFGQAGRAHTVLVCLAEGRKYSVRWNGEVLAVGDADGGADGVIGNAGVGGADGVMRNVGVDGAVGVLRNAEEDGAYSGTAADATSKGVKYLGGGLLELRLPADESGLLEIASE